jgi:hypothetical protein
LGGCLMIELKNIIELSKSIPVKKKTAVQSDGK